MLDIRIDDKRYGARPVLRDLALRARRGEIVSLIGASGCGKSSLLSIVAGLDPHFTGSLSLDGAPLRGPHADIGFIFQEPRLFPWLTVAQNVAFGAGKHPQLAARVADLLAEVGLEQHAGALPKSLSGGQAQRAAIARGLCTQPRVLLLDEPFSAVDAFTRMKLQDLLLRVARRHGLTLLLVTHDIDEALYLSDRIVLLDTGPGPLRAEFIPPPAGSDPAGDHPARGDPARGDAVRNDPAHAALKSAILDSLHAAHAI